MFKKYDGSRLSFQDIKQSKPGYIREALNIPKQREYGYIDVYKNSVNKDIDTLKDMVYYGASHDRLRNAIVRWNIYKREGNNNG